MNRSPRRRVMEVLAPVLVTGREPGIGRRDVLMVLSLYVVDLALFSEWWTQAGRWRWTALVFTVALALNGVLLWRRHHPVTVFALVWVGTMTAALVPRYHPYLAVLVALFAVAVRRPAAMSAGALVSTTAPFTVLGMVETNERDSTGTWSDVVGSTAVWVLIALVVWLAAGRVRAYVTRVGELDARRRAAASEAVAAERLRIARDLHDILAHSVSVMVLQAAGARRVIRSDPARADRALEVIEQTGQQSMQELRRLLGVLRASSGAGSAADVDQCQPGLDDIPQLVELSRRTGMRVTLHVSGQACQLDPSVELAAYRVVQEALTNTRKHGGAEVRAEVALNWSADGLTVGVASRAAGPGATVEAHGVGPLSNGYGLLGLRERVQAIGGSFDAGAVVEGFCVEAVLPCSVIQTGSTHPSRPERS